MSEQPNQVTRIGVLADTHLPATGEGFACLHDIYSQYLHPVDMIMHAGDLVAEELLAVFAPCPVHAVRGNMDPFSPGIPTSKVIRVGSFNIGLIHGWGSPERLEQRILSKFPEVRLDCIVYGHSHRPVSHWQDGILFFNPGSATDRRFTAYHSVGILEVGETIQGHIIPLD